jgi:membrane associated rhomboid family serine protease
MSLTLLLIALTAVSSYMAFQRRAWMGEALLVPSLMRGGGQWHRLLTHAFIHRDWVHAGVNLFVLWMFGEVVEEQFRWRFGTFGPLAYTGLYLGGILASSLPIYAKRREDPGYAALGASGAVSAVVFSYIVFFPLERICLYFVLCLPSALAGLLYLAYSSYMDRRGGTGIAHDAHLYGALWGLAFPLALRPGLAGEFLEQLGLPVG